MSNAMQVYENFDNLQRAAIALQESGYFPDAQSKAKAITKVMAGAELGLPPFASMTGIHIIQGKPTLGANVIATLVKNDPRYDYRIKQSDDNACIIVWHEGGQIVGEAGFTIQEAQSAGLTGKDIWKKYTSDMLFARAISRGARRFAPGIFGGSPVYTPDELGADTDEDGYINATTYQAPSPTVSKPDDIEDGQYTDAEPEPEPLTIEWAAKVENSEGQRYIDMPNTTLDAIAKKIDEVLSGDVDAPENAELREKLKAIAVIKAARANGEI